MVLTNPTLLTRLSEIGVYEVKIDGPEVSVEWESPKDFPRSAIAYGVCFTAEHGGDANRAISSLVDEWAKLQDSMDAMLTQVETILLAGFRDVYQDQLDDDELNDVRDDTGQITNKSILSAVESGTVLLMAESYEGVTQISTIFTHRVPWDREHGISIHIEDGELVWGD